MNSALLLLAQRGLNRALALDPELPRVLAPLAGVRVAVEIAGAAPVGVLVTVARDGVLLAPGAAPGEPARPDADVTVRGSPAALLALLSRADALPGGAGVSVRGDIGVLGRVRDAAQRLRPDWEEPLARALGDELAYPLARGLRHAAGQIARATRELRADAEEFLREESGWLAAADEVAAFSAGVDALRDAVERLDKRLDRVARDAVRDP